MFEVGEGAAFVSGEALTLLLAEPRRNSCNRAPHEAPVLTRSRSPLVSGGPALGAHRPPCSWSLWMCSVIYHRNLLFSYFLHRNVCYVMKVVQLCPTLCSPMDCSPWNSLGQNTGVGSLFLFQGIFPNQGSNSGLQHCRRILHQLGHKGSPE